MNIEDINDLERNIIIAIALIAVPTAIAIAYPLIYNFFTDEWPDQKSETKKQKEYDRAVSREIQRQRFAAISDSIKKCINDKK